MEKLPESTHFSLEKLTDGVYACIHKPGGAAYANAGIIDLGDRTLLVDAFDTMAAGRELRATAETLFNRPVDTIFLTHPHSDHWIGASAFDPATTLLSSEITRKVCIEWGKRIMEDFQDTDGWAAWLKEMEDQLQNEKDESSREGLYNSILRARYTMAEMDEFQPRYADQTFEEEILFEGSQRTALLRSYGPGHSEDDAVILLREDNIAFIGDIGFFDTQPFLGFCNIDHYRAQLDFFHASGYHVFVPGHGPVGFDKAYIGLQIEYLNILEELVRNAVQHRETFEQALQIKLPKRFDRWLYGGMGRFEANVRYLFTHLGGEIPEQ